jgi:hypothetical protein
MNSTEVSSLAAHNRCLSRPNLTVAEDRGVSEYFVLCSERLLDAICTQLCEFVVAGCPMSIEVCSRLAHGEGIIGRHPHKLSTFLHLAAPTRSPHGRAALRVRFGTSLEGVTRPFFFFFFLELGGTLSEKRVRLTVYYGRRRFVSKALRKFGRCCAF